MYSEKTNTKRTVRNLRNARYHQVHGPRRRCGLGERFCKRTRGMPKYLQKYQVNDGKIQIRGEYLRLVRVEGGWACMCRRMILASHSSEPSRENHAHT